MDGQSLWWIIIGVLGVVSAIPVLFQIIKKIWNFLYVTLLFKNLRVRATGRRSYSGRPHVTIKTAFTGKEEMIVEEVIIQSKLYYPRRIDGILAWVQLGISYLLDDVVGLRTMLGDSFPSVTWIPGAPVHRIKKAYIRKPLSVILGVITFYYFINFLIPVFWPFLFGGPYMEFRLFSGNEEIRLLEESSKAELKRPFILKSGVENSLNISYKPSLYIYTLLMTKVLIKNAKVSYMKEPHKFRIIKHPRNNEFAWKVIDILRIKVSGKMRRYSVNLGDSYVNIRL